MQKQSLTLKRRPDGLPLSGDFELVDAEIAPLADGEILVRVDLISLDPAMRGWMNEGRSYIGAVQLGDAVRAIGVGTVLASQHPIFAAGDAVTGLFGVQSHWSGAPDGVRKIDLNRAAPEKYLNPLGMPGQTAHFGLLEVGGLNEGETVVVSAAAGAVGSLVGQIAKAHGCRVFGIAGGFEKCARVVDVFGFDGCIDYKSEPVAKALRGLTGGEIDIYFDNVGGPALEAAMANLNKHARVVICGAIAGYNDMSQLPAPRNYINLLIQSARMEGFVVFDYFPRYAESDAAMGGLMKDGILISHEQIESGLERFSEVFAQLFSGQNAGKLILAPAA